MLNSDIQKLKYWQKKYLIEGVFVLIAAISVMVAVCFYIEYWGFCLLTGIVIGAIVFLMWRALREELQTRAEMLILEKHKELLDDITFEVGHGVDTDTLLALNVIDEHQARDGFNVLKRSNCILEEDLFYTEHSFKYFTLRNTAFRGVILAIKAERAMQGVSADGTLIGKNMLIDGDLKSFLIRCDCDTFLPPILKLFGVSKVKIVSANGWIYFWIETSKRLFYQFSLVQEISPLPFISRMQQLKSLADKLTEAFSV